MHSASQASNITVPSVWYSYTVDAQQNGMGPSLLTKTQRWSLLVTVGAGLLLVTLDNSILYTALPTLTEQLGATGSQSLWVINAYPVVMAGLLLGTGTLGDRIGHRRMFLIGLVIFGGASSVAAFAHTPIVLIAARALLAVGAATMMPATLALIRVSFQEERERNIAFAIWGSLAVVGSALGPIIGGILLEHFWWGSVFLINVPVVILALVATRWVAPLNDPDPTKRWDLVSSAQAMLGLVGAVVAVKELAHAAPDWLVILVAVSISTLGFTLFGRRQRRLDDPLLDIGIFRSPALASGVMAAVFGSFAISGSQLITTQRFQLVEGFSPLQAGLLVAAVAIGSLPTAVLGGAVLHRTGLQPLIAGGLAVGALGVTVALVGVETASLGVLIASLLVMGAGLGAAMSVASTAIVGNVPVRRAGMASSVDAISYELGSLISVALLGSLLTFVYSTAVQLPADAPDTAQDSITSAVATGDRDIIDSANTAFDTGYIVTMIVLAIILAVGAAISGWMLRRIDSSSPNSPTSDRSVNLS